MAGQIRKFDEETIGLLHRTMMEGASMDDVKVFVQTCERTGLDPFAGQIMPTKRVNNIQVKGQWVKKEIWSALVRIDGLRKIAVDSGEYTGQQGPFWCGQDGEWKDVWLKKEPPSASRVIVYRKGFEHGLTGVALFDSYAQKKADGSLNNVWANLGEVMVAKCAEALALRKAFPNEMAGLYTTDEMAQADNPKKESPKATPEAEKQAPPAPPAGEPAKDEPWGSWTTDLREVYATLMDRLYSALKKADGLTAWEAQQEKWRGICAASKTPDADLGRLTAFVVKCEVAADEKAKKATLTPTEEATENWAKIREAKPWSALTKLKWADEQARLIAEWSADREDKDLAVVEGQRKLLAVL